MQSCSTNCAVQEETQYARAVLADTEGLQDKLYKEMRGRIQEEDQSTPQRDKGYFYYSRTLEGKQYKVICRRKVPEKAGPPSGQTFSMLQLLSMHPGSRLWFSPDHACMLPAISPLLLPDFSFNGNAF